MVDFVVDTSGMEYPNQRVITKLWFKECFYQNSFLLVHMKFENIARTDDFFQAFLHKEAIYSSMLKVLSVSTFNSFCFSLSPIFVFPVFAQTFSYWNDKTTK